MAATREDIIRWLVRAVEEEWDFLIVVCDTFDWEDYPVGVSREKFWEKHDEMAKASMQKIMEVYDLGMDTAAQLDEHRANHPPARPGH